MALTEDLWESHSAALASVSPIPKRDNKILSAYTDTIFYCMEATVAAAATAAATASAPPLPLLLPLPSFSNNRTLFIQSFNMN